MEHDNVGVHASHCCQYHGCKYGDDDCPVSDLRVDQEQECETCIDSNMVVVMAAALGSNGSPHVGVKAVFEGYEARERADRYVEEKAKESSDLVWSVQEHCERLTAE